MTDEIERDKIYCKKLSYKNVLPNGEHITSTILGLITYEDDQFLCFRTAKKSYRISKALILNVVDTYEYFRDENGDEIYGTGRC